ncbi:MAG: hypothetical protein ACK41Z_04960 [Sediminibacterium sp.]
MAKNASVKIPCVVLVYYNFDIIKKTVDFLSLDKRLVLYVIENKSPFTSTHIRPYLLKKQKQGLIKKYVLFDRNISNNAYELFFDNNLIEEQGEYILITDGDMVVPSKLGKPDWLDEEISIINNYSDIECCGINLSPENLPKDNPFFNNNTNKIYNCENWIPDKFGIIHEDFVEADTGVHLLLFKRSTFEEFLFLRKKSGWRFLDENLRNFIKSEKKMKWVITKHNYCLHLTWDIYNDPNHPYTILKMTPDFYKFWKHFDYCFFTVYENGKKKRFYPKKAIRAFLKKFVLRKQLSKI